MDKNKALSYMLLCLFIFTFYFKGDTLYWKVDGKETPMNFMRMQLDHQIIPAVNTEPIREIKSTGDGHLFIFAGKKWWVLNYNGIPQSDWFVEGPYEKEERGNPLHRADNRRVKG